MASKRKHTFIVEHLDPELEEWQALEYNTICTESTAADSIFLLSGLTTKLTDSSHGNPETNLLRIPEPSRTKQTVEALYPSPEARQKICLLDPKAEQDLSPSDGEAFDGFLFGGILGDDPPRDRTGDLRKLGFPGRRLGPEQMTTDTAVRVTRLVVQDGKALGEIEFVSRPEIEIEYADDEDRDDGKSRVRESVEMPFKYVKGTDGRPVMPAGMVELLTVDSQRGIFD